MPYSHYKKDIVAKVLSKTASWKQLLHRSLETPEPEKTTRNRFVRKAASPATFYE
jgi:hypothetical protein